MTDYITIPRGALTAVEAEIRAGIAKGLDPEEFARAVCLAMLENWPNVRQSVGTCLAPGGICSWWDARAALEEKQ